MVCLAASIVTKGGKVLVSRQFVEMNRIRVEGLLAAFPKLVGSGSQHTYVETENVRYVYQPLEGMYLLLITNKQSNILEDLETVRLLAKVVPEYVQPVEEQTVCEFAFELLFAFDEVISLGHREEVTVAQVRQNTEMKSNEEELHKMIIQSKIDEVKNVMKLKAGEIDRAKLDRKGTSGGEPWRTNAAEDLLGRMGLNSVENNVPSLSAPVSGFPSSSYSQPSRPSGTSKGMQLGKGKKNDMLAALAKEGEPMDTSAGFSSVPAAAAAASAAARDPVTIDIEERLTVRMNKEGGLESMEVQGTMTLLCNADEHATVQLILQAGRNEGMQFKTHPNIDKSVYAQQQIIGLKDPSRPFPTGTPLGVLKWRYQTTDEARVPIAINCWPTVSGSDTYIAIEYESSVSYDLRNVIVSIPGVFSPPKVNECDGTWQYEPRNACVQWKMELVDDSNRTGSMELVVAAAATESFFPVTVSFSAKETMCDMHVPQVVNVQTSQPTRYSFSKMLVTDSFQVVH